MTGKTDLVQGNAFRLPFDGSRVPEKPDIWHGSCIMRTEGEPSIPDEV